MKKIIIILILIILGNIMLEKQEENEEIKGVFISYIELSEYIKGKEENQAKDNIQKMLEKIRNLKLNTIILQVRPTADAIYPSKLYPTSTYIVEKEGEDIFDVLDYFLYESHKRRIKVFAWINPYRIRTTENLSSITPKSPAYKYLNTDTIYIKNGIYWNPSKEEVTKLILDGVEELLNYKIDALLLDDYFYPDDEIDKNDYFEFHEKHPEITEDEYRKKIINHLVEEVHNICKKKKIKFGISPDGNINNNYENHHADVKKWLESSNYIDFIMPQIYYGFYNSTQGYLKVIKEWESLIVEKSIDFYIALAFYKVGKEDIYARNGRGEWLENDNIIMREILLARSLKNYKGFSLFRYDNLFNKEKFTNNSQKEIENLQKIIKE